MPGVSSLPRRAPRRSTSLQVALVKSARDDFQAVLSLAREPERFNYLRGNPKKRRVQTAGERTGMQSRDQKQWVEWLKM